MSVLVGLPFTGRVFSADGETELIGFTTWGAESIASVSMGVMTSKSQKVVFRIRPFYRTVLPSQRNQARD